MLLGWCAWLQIASAAARLIPVAHPTSRHAASHSPGDRCINETAWHAGRFILPRSECYPLSHLHKQTSIQVARHKESSNNRVYSVGALSLSLLDSEHRFPDIGSKRTMPLHHGCESAHFAISQVIIYTRYVCISPYWFHSNALRTAVVSACTYLQ
ncbi:hypothetical protein J3F84DRAFT_255611 [Trichoderma pleuroticola]